MLLVSCNPGVPHSVRPHCSSSAPLHDYWMVSLLQHIHFILCRILFLTPQLLVFANYTVTASSRRSLKTWHWQAFWKCWRGTEFSEWQNKKLIIFSCKKRQTRFEQNNSQNPPSLFQVSRRQILNLSKLASLCFTELPKTSLLPLFRSSFFSTSSIIKRQKLEECRGTSSTFRPPGSKLLTISSYKIDSRCMYMQPQVCER